METQRLRKTFKYPLMPTPEQERALETALLRCRTLYNVALEQRKTWWGRGQSIGASYYQQKAAVPDLKAACSEYGEVHSQVLQEVLLHVERTFQAFFRRVKNGETPSYPRFQGHEPLSLLHLSPVWQRRGAGWGHPQPLQDWPDSHSVASAPARPSTPRR